MPRKKKQITKIDKDEDNDWLDNEEEDDSLNYNEGEELPESWEELAEDEKLLHADYDDYSDEEDDYWR